MAVVDGEHQAERVKAAAGMYIDGYPLVYSLSETGGFAMRARRMAAAGLMLCLMR